MGWTVPSSCVARLGLTVSAAELPSGRDSQVVLYLCNPTLQEWELTEGEALARLVLLPAVWTSTVAKFNVPSTGGKVWVKLNDKWREGEIIAEGEGMSKWLCNKGNPAFY